MLDFKHEVFRKLIHLTSLWIPLLYYYSNQNKLLKILIFVSIVIISIDFFRRYSNFLNNLVNKFLFPVMRQEEAKKLSSASYFLLASIITIYLFTKEIAIFGLTILIFCDTSASLIGKYFGKNKIFDKSFEGSFAFIISGTIILLLLKYIFLFKINLYVGLIAIFFSCFCELIAKKIAIDDNLLIPLAVGFCFEILS